MACASIEHSESYRKEIERGDIVHQTRQRRHIEARLLGVGAQRLKATPAPPWLSTDIVAEPSRSSPGMAGRAACAMARTRKDGHLVSDGIGETTAAHEAAQCSVELLPGEHDQEARLGLCDQPALTIQHHADRVEAETSTEAALPGAFAPEASRLSPSRTRAWGTECSSTTTFSRASLFGAVMNARSISVDASIPVASRSAATPSYVVAASRVGGL